MVQQVQWEGEKISEILCRNRKRHNVGSQETTQEQNPKRSRLMKDLETEKQRELGRAGIQREEK